MSVDHLEQAEDETLLVLPQHQIVRFEQEAFVNAQQSTPLNKVVHVVPGEETLGFHLITVHRDRTKK